MFSRTGVGFILSIVGNWLDQGKGMLIDLKKKKKELPREVIDEMYKSIQA